MGYFLISMKKTLNYRWHVFFSVVSILLMAWTNIFLWGYIYRGNEEMQQYMTVYVILSHLLSLLYTSRFSECISDKVYKGTFAIDLLRPIHFLKLNFIEVTGEAVAGLIIKGIPAAVVLFAVYRQLICKIRPLYALLGAAAICLAFLLYMMLYTILGLLSFWFYEVWPFNRLMNDTIRFLSGSVIPIALFPAWLSWPIRILPFRYLYSFPIELVLKGGGGSDIGKNFAGLLGWDILLAAVMLIVYKRALLRCVVQGG